MVALRLSVFLLSVSLSIPMHSFAQTKSGFLAPGENGSQFIMRKVADCEKATPQAGFKSKDRLVQFCTCSAAIEFAFGQVVSADMPAPSEEAKKNIAEAFKAFSVADIEICRNAFSN